MKYLKHLHPSSTSMTMSAVLGLALFGASLNSAIAQEDPRFVPPGQFQKLVATASSLELLEARLTEDGVESEAIELLRVPFDLRPANMTDLVIQLNGECATFIGTEPDAVIPPPPAPPEGEDDDPPENGETSVVTGASVNVWAEVNGERVGGDNGAVVLCNSNGSAEVALDVEELIAAYEKDRTAGGFQWVAADVGQGSHEIVIMAELEVHTEVIVDDDDDNGDNGENGNGNGDESHADSAAAIIGNRVVVLERTRALFHDENGNDDGEL
jgi:hypothetical protein